MKLVVFSICKDEADTIGEVLDLIPKKIPGIDTVETLVISDGSKDSTVKNAKEHNATLVIEGKQQKKLAYRFEQALDIVLGMGADIAVNVDGDLQFNPRDIPKLLEPILKDGYDFVAADRFTDNDGQSNRPDGMPAGKYWANRLGAKIVSNLTGQRFNDVTCGFRAYNRKAMLKLNINSNYTYTQESFQVLAIKKMNIKTVPTEVKYYKGRKSRVVKNFWQFLFGSGINILRAYRDYAPLKFFGVLGMIVFVPGIVLGSITIIHWFSVGSVTPYVTVGFLGLYLVTAAFFLWALGLVADMMDRILNNQEKILERVKTVEFNKRKQ